MKDAIVKALTDQAEARNCRILLAVESGSRAWGFASPDSDYDIRAVYVKPLDWYLGIKEPMSDTWEAMLPGELDVSAWDLRKALRQLLKSNASLLEWIGSPIVYADTGLLAPLAELAQRAFNPAHVAFHYAAMFRHALANRTADGTMSVKKLCYALRANAAVAWVRTRETMPPTEFVRVLEGIDLADDTRRAIDDLLRLKSGAAEKDRILPSAALTPLLVDHFEELSAIRWTRTNDPLDEVRMDCDNLFRSIAKQL